MAAAEHIAPSCSPRCGLVRMLRERIAQLEAALAARDTEPADTTSR